MAKLVALANLFARVYIVKPVGRAGLVAMNLSTIVNIEIAMVRLPLLIERAILTET